MPLRSEEWGERAFQVRDPNGVIVELLDWNAPAIEFYQRLGATIMSDWQICRMTPPEIMKLAGKST